MDDLTRQGIDAFRAGKRDEARKLLLTAVKQNPNSESAWGWLYNVAENDKERIYCLKQVLRINPNNEKVNQLYKSLLDRQSQLESSQPQVSKQISQQVPTASQPIQKQPVQSNKSTNKKSNSVSLDLSTVRATGQWTWRSVLHGGLFRPLDDRSATSSLKILPDAGDSAAFSSIFLASGFSCSRTFSTPAHTPLTQTVRLLRSSQ